MGDHYRDEALSRNETASAPSGFAEPRLVTRGGVTWTERDPYSENPNITFTFRESESSRKAQAQAMMDAEIGALKRNLRIREGIEAPPDRMMSTYLRSARKPYGFQKVQRGFELLKQLRPDLYERLPARKSLLAVVLVMHHLVPGRFPKPPA